MTITVPGVPFLDLVGHTAQFRAEVDAAIARVLDHGAFVGGGEVAAFEAEFAAYCQAAHCVGVGNGTEAIVLILAALGIGRGDEVILPTNTFVATAEAIVEVGAVPVFVDVDPDTLLIDPAAAADAVGRRTAAIIGVHLFGQISDLDTLRSITTRHGLALVEDAAQSHGARDLGRRAGGIGDAAAFSFYPGKNLGAFGDGGAVTTDDPALAERVRVLADHGRSRTDRHRHDVPGRNSRLDALQAAVLRVKLRRLNVDNRARSAAMAAYREQLDLFAGSVAVRAGAEPVHHLAVFRFADRDAVTARMTVNQIGWGIHYPVPCHLQPAFRTRSRLRVAEQAAQQICSLPLSPTISPEQIDRVCAVIRSVVHP